MAVRKVVNLVTIVNHVPMVINVVSPIIAVMSAETVIARPVISRPILMTVTLAAKVAHECQITVKFPTTRTICKRSISKQHVMLKIS